MIDLEACCFTLRVIFRVASPCLGWTLVSVPAGSTGILFLGIFEKVLVALWFLIKS